MALSLLTQSSRISEKAHINQFFSLFFFEVVFFVVMEGPDSDSITVREEMWWGSSFTIVSMEGGLFFFLFLSAFLPTLFLEQT